MLLWSEPEACCRKDHRDRELAGIPASCAIVTVGSVHNPRSVCWGIAMVLVLPLAGRWVFAINLGWRAPAALLASHLVYGVIIAGP